MNKYERDVQVANAVFAEKHTQGKTFFTGMFAGIALCTLCIMIAQYLIGSNCF